MSGKKDLLTKNYIVALLAMVCCILWGSAFPCVKIGYRMFGISTGSTGSQILFAGCRFFIAGLLVILFESVQKKRFIYPHPKDYGKVVKLSIFQTIIQYDLFYIGLANTTGVKASIIIGSNVFVAILISGLIFRIEKITFNKIAGCIVGFAGVALINMNGADIDMSLKFTGEGFMFISTISYSVSSVLMKRYSQDCDPVMLSGWQFTFGGAVMAVTGLIAGGTMHPHSPEAFILGLYLAFISAVAYTLWGILLKHNPVSKVAVYGFMNPVCGVTLSALLLGETSQAFGLKGAISLLLVCLGIYAVNFKGVKS
ncbi:MAG: DMT family transporter [Oscillospiraceae bacterium]|nr:DMT family transporter [Oscillospiraceae bacterium]